MAVKGPNIIKTDLAFHIDAANINSYNQSATWKDISKNVHILTLQNNPTFSTENAGILTFNGTNNYTGTSAPEITVSPNNVWTVCGWIKPLYQPNRVINPQSTGAIQSISYDSTEAIRITICDAAGSNIRNRLSTPNSVPSNSWTYFCISINNLEIKMYMNGVLNSTYNESIAISGWGGWWWLFTNNAQTVFYSGSVSNMSCYNKILTNSEILHNYNVLKSRFVLN